MNRQIWRVAAALVVATAVIGVIGIFQNGGQAAYAFEQTVAAMQGKRSFHIQTYYASPTQRHDEFWAEFDEQGQVIRVRQSDQWKREDHPVQVLWEDQVEYEYRPWKKLLVIHEAQHHVDKNKLEEFDPETMIEDAYRDVENGEATVEIHDAPTEDGHLVVEVEGGELYGGRRVLLVDPVTKLVLRMDIYHDDDEGNWSYKKGIEVLEYNQSFDPKLFDPRAFQSSFPDDTIVIDQVSKPVGLAQGDLSDAEAAVEVTRQALDALALDDHETAGRLFGGAPPEYFERRRGVLLKPIADIVVGEPEPREWYGPTFEVPCSCGAEHEGRLTTVNWTFWVKTGEGQLGGRWFIDPAFILEFSIEE